MQKIIRLSEAVINQIAAGEVVENPASIVKELVENSLDAQATRIEISIEGGGHQLIQVEDDGCGMNREDALLSLERHATSKIREVADLETLHTMGFRGEALAAIAAVSRFEMKTSAGGEGTWISSERGEALPCARNRGTSIFVRSLFYNVPARRKFQKSPSSSAAMVVRVVETLAMAHPEIAFRLSSQGESLMSLDPQPRRERIEAILGPFRHESVSDPVWALLAAPEEAKAQRRGQYFFINKRPLFSPFISRAVQAGYGTRIAEQRHPPFVLFLEISQGEIDVNVHPQKREVRFRNEGKIFRLIESAVASAFKTPFSFQEPIAFTPPPIFEKRDFTEQAPIFSFQEEKLDLELEERPLFVSGSFLFLQKEDLLLIDLQRAKARILFEGMRAKKSDTQALIWPLEIEEEDSEIEEELQKLGIECRRMGKKILAIDALPTWLEAAHFSAFLDAWKEGKSLDRTLSRFCRSIKKSYSLREAHLTWKELQKCSDSLYDPLGQLIWKVLKPEELL